MKRGQLMDALRSLGVDKPEPLTQDLSDPAIAGTVKKAQQKQKAGMKFGPGLIVTWLREGGDEGFGNNAPPPRPWWTTWKGRQFWLERNVGDLNLLHAETAIIGLTQQNREPSVALVREWTELVERQEREYDAACRALVAAQRKAALSGRDRSSQGCDTPNAPPTRAPDNASSGDEVRVSRPESAKEKREHSLPLGSPSD